MVNKSKLLTVCICTYGQPPCLLQTLQRLANQSETTDKFDVIIVDNTINQICSFSDNIKDYIADKKNIKYVMETTDGLSGARNYCLNKVQTKFVHFIDDDVLVGHNFVYNILTRISKNENIQAIGGKVIPNWSRVKRPEWLKNENLGYLSMVDFGDTVLNFGQKSGMWFAGANICFNREDVLKIGGFCEKLGRKGSGSTLMGSEEMDVVSKLDKNKMIYDPSIVVEHIVSPDRVKPNWFIKRASWQAVSDAMTNNLYMKNVGTWSDQKKPDEYVKENISTFFKNIDNENTLTKKIKTIQLLVFLALMDDLI